MPIGTIYGFFIGTLICSLIFIALEVNSFIEGRVINHADRNYRCKQLTLGIVSICSIVGTYIEVGFGS
jgi:hypothetical protein